MKKTFQGIRKEEKGVSPVIAVILLIAIAVVAAGIAYVWVTSFTTGTTAKVSGATSDFDVHLLILKAKKGTNYVVVKNTGSDTATKVTVYVNGTIKGYQASLQGGNITRITLNGGNFYLNKTWTVDVTCEEGAMATATVK